MRFNKKGLMVKFLVTIVLAIIIFAPACLVSSKLFRLSDQAKESFVDFIIDVKDLAGDTQESELVKQETSLMILDDDSFIAFFKEGDETAIVGGNYDESQMGAYHKFYGFYFDYPTELCNGGACACLCRDYDTIVPDTNTKTLATDELAELFYDQRGVFSAPTGYLYYEVKYSCLKLSCEDLNDGILARSWGLERNEDHTESSEFRRISIQLLKDEKGTVSFYT